MRSNIALFPTAILNERGFLNPDQCRDIHDFLKLKEGDLKPHSNIINDEESKSTYSENEDILNDIRRNVKGCGNVILDVNDHAKDYGKLSGFKMKGEMMNSWFNVQNVNSVLTEHTHPLSVLSGALFINVNEDSSPLCFQNPNPHVSFTPREKDTTYNGAWVEFKPEMGELFLFPSWLKHGSNGVKNNFSERTVISFNMI